MATMNNPLELFFPVKNPAYISQRFGENPDFYKANYGVNGHNGWDIVGETGQVIRAAHDGEVTFTGEDGKGGLGVVIRTLDQREYSGGAAFIKSIYWHCLPNSFLVKPGDIVKVGDPLAKCDSTGFISSAAGNGSHVHFGIKPVAPGENDWTWSNIEQNNGFGGAIDPAPYFSTTIKYAEDFASISSQIKSLQQKVLELIKKLFAIQ